MMKLEETPRTLAYLSSIRIAWDCWMKKFRENGAIDDFPSLDSLRRELEDIIALKNTSVEIAKIIDSEIRTWFENFGDDLNSPRCNCISSRLDNVVFGGNGTIHLKDTTENFLDDESLDNVTKFKMACEICWGKKIDFFWSLLKDPLSVDGLKFEENFILYYWICRKSGHLRRISLQGYSRIELLMMEKCCTKRKRSAIEYFVSSLRNSGDRLAEIDELFDSDSGVRCVLYVLPHLDDTSQRYVLEKNGIFFLEECFEDLELCKYAVQIWISIQDYFTPESFYTDIILHLGNGFTNKQGRLDDHSNVKDEILAGIWINSSPKLRQYAIKFFPQIVSKLKQGPCLPNFDRSVKFLLALLNDADLKTRSRFWTAHWSKWIVNVSAVQFEKLITVCLAQADVEDFKGRLPNTEVFLDYCDKLICLGYHNKLDEFFNGLYSDQARIVDMKKNILANAKKIFLNRLRYRMLDKHVKYIDQVFSNDSLEVRDEFKRQLIFSNDVWKYICDRIDRNDSEDLKILINAFRNEKIEKEISYISRRKKKRLF